MLISYQLLPTAAEKHAIYKNSVYGVVVCLAIFNLLWLMGSEGSASLGLSQEVGIYVIVDVVLKTGLGLYIVLQYGAFRNLSSLPSPLNSPLLCAPLLSLSSGSEQNGSCFLSPPQILLWRARARRSTLSSTSKDCLFMCVEGGSRARLVHGGIAVRARVFSCR